MFLVKFFKGLKNSKKPQKNYNLEVSHEEKEVKDVDIHILPHSLSNDSIKTNEKANEIAINHVLPSEEPKKILIKNKAISAIDVNNMEKCRNIKKKKLSIQPLKVKFQEKNGQKTLSIAKNNVKSYENHVEISKDNSIFDKIDKILAKSTAYNAKNKKNYEKDLITIYSKNKVIHTIKGKDEKIIKKPMYFQKIFGNKNRKNKVKTRVIEEKKRNKSSIHANNLSVENYADENSVRYEANSLQEIKNLNISEIKQKSQENDKVMNMGIWDRFSLAPQNKIERNKSSLEAEYEKIELLHQKNDLALKDYLYIKENLIEIQRKRVKA